MKREIASTSVKSLQLKHILALCKERNSLSADTLSKYALLAKKLAYEVNDSKLASWADFYVAFTLLTKGKSDSSLLIASPYLKQQYESAKDKELYLRFFLLEANALNRANKTKDALEKLYRLLEEVEKKEDHYAMIYIYNYIGTSYQILGQSKEAQQWFYKAIFLPESASLPIFKEAYSSAILNTGITYFSLYQENKQQKEADSSEFYINKAISIATRSGFLSTLAYADNMLGLLYSFSNRTIEAEKLLMGGLQIRKEIGDPYYIISDIIALGDFYANTKQAEKGISICLQGISIAKQYQVTADLTGLYSTLAENYKVKGDYINYAAVLKSLVTLKDSVYKVNTADKIAELQTKYDVQKKENIIIQQKYDISRKNYLIYATLLFLLATLLTAYITFQSRKKSQQLKMQELMMEQKQKTTEAVMHAEEEERKRIAGDLHDSVAQKMVVAKLNLEALGNHLKKFSTEEQKIYDNVNALLEESAKEVRQLSHSLMPESFAHSDLTDAVKEFLDKISLDNLQINFSADGDFSGISKNTSLMIYRIIQEAVQNTLKHATASVLDVSMIVENNELDITIEDNGIGFDVEEVTILSNQGLRNIQSRIEYLSGKLDINSQPGEGTLLAFFIPLSKKL